MKYKVFTIYDTKGETYNMPWFVKTHGEAERTFSNLANDERTNIAKNPEDYDLFQIGEFDDQTGTLTPHQTPTHVVKALHLLREKSADQGLQ